MTERRRYKQAYDPGVPTRWFSMNKMRVDVRERLYQMAKKRGVTVNELVNQILDGGLKMFEAVEKRKERDKTEYNDFMKSVLDKEESNV